MSQIITLERLTDDVIRSVGNAAKAGKIIAFPTDTVYGLGSNALIPASTKRIYELKQRPADKPLPVFVHSIEAAKRWVKWTALADALGRRFWPGALTLVLEPTEEGKALTTADFRTVAIRVPNHPTVLKLLQASGVPWAQTSANRSGQSSLTDGADVVKTFAGAVDWIVDGGRTAGIESTIVDAAGAAPRLIREGAVKASEILSSGVSS